LCLFLLNICMLKKQNTRPLCLNCLVVPSKPNGISKMGYKKYHKYCTPCSKLLYSEKYKLLKKKGMTCESCGFIAKDYCQLDVVYKNSNKKNKTPTNIKIYCSNCYKLYKKRLKISMKSVMNVTVDSDIRIC
jgi:hypothetical protein